MIEREGGLDIEKKYEANFERWFHKRLYNSKRSADNESSNYMILHVTLIITLDRIEVTL
jgi:hypothetical protein